MDSRLNNFFECGTKAAMLGLSRVTSFAADTNSVFLFSFFREPDGHAGLFLATSTNGLDWTELKAPNGKSFLEPQVGGKLMRDPCLRLAVSDQAEGPYGEAGPAITGDWVEGPSGIQIGPDFYIYFDHYGNPKYYGGVKSPDLEHWQDISAQMSFPKGFRHGTVLRVPEAVVNHLSTWNHQSTTKNQP